MQMLTRFFLHVDTSQEELGTLADSAVGLMTEVVRPLGLLMTTLPVGSTIRGRPPDRVPRSIGGPRDDLPHRH